LVKKEDSMKIQLFLLIAGFLMVLSGSSAIAGENKLVLTGSSTVAPLVLEIAKRFEKENQGIRVDVQTGGSSRGINDTRLALADIGMVSRALKPEESDLTPFTIAMDGIGLIVHKSNPMQKLSDEQIKDIYTGAIENWKDAGGADMPITVVNKAEGRSTLELFLKHFSLKNSDIKADVVIGDNQQGIKTVSGSPGSIGYVSIGTAEYEEQHGTPIRLLPMEGTPATVENVQNETFPLSRQLNLVVKNTPSPLAIKFIEYAQSKDVHDLIEAQFFVPLADE